MAMFIFWNVIFKKKILKFFYICLLLKKVINEKHFPIKIKFYLVFRKVFFLLAVFVFRKVVFGKPFSKLLCVCLSLEKLVNGKHFPVKENLAWFLGKCFLEKFGWKTLSGNCEKFRNVIICWLYQIWSSNFWLLYIFCFEYLFFNFIS